MAESMRIAKRLRAYRHHYRRTYNGVRGDRRPTGVTAATERRKREFEDALAKARDALVDEIGGRGRLIVEVQATTRMPALTVVFADNPYGLAVYYWDGHGEAPLDDLGARGWKIA